MQSSSHKKAEKTTSFFEKLKLVDIICIEICIKSVNTK